MIFEYILTEAAQKLREQEVKAEALRKERWQDVHQDAAKRKHFPKAQSQTHVKKGLNGVKGASYLDPHREYILSEYKKGTKTKVIAECLGEKGVRVSPKYLSYYLWKVRNEEGKGQSLKGKSKLDDHHDYLKQAIAAGKSWSLMSRELQSTRQVNIISHAISEYCRKKGLV